MPSITSRRFSTTSFSSLNGGMPNVSSPPMRVVTIEHDRRHAVAHEDVRASEARRPRADDGDALAASACTFDMSGLQPGLNASSVMYFSIGADRHCAEAVVERARALAQTILRADAAAHLGQRVRLVRQLRCFEEVAFLDRASASSECSCGPGTSIRRTDCRRRGSAPPADAAPPASNCA